MSNLISKIVVPSSTEATGYALYNIKDANAIRSSEKGVASGVATLDSSGKVPSSQLPSYVDDVIEGYYHDNKFYATYTPGEEGQEDVYSDEITAESGKIYVDKNTNQSYRWSGSAYIVISSPYTLPTASANILGGVKVGDGLSIDNNGVLSAEGQYENEVVLTTGTSTTAVMSQNAVTNAISSAYESKTASEGGTDVSLVTTGEKYNWDTKGTYSKPSGGIPKTDLDSTVQTSLGLADTAIQSHQDISGKADKTSTVSNVSYDSTNKKITETINNVTTDIVTAQKIYLDSGATSYIRKTDFDLAVLKQAVADGDLGKYGLKVGDQKTINGYTYVIAGLNPMKGSVTPYRLTTNHVGLIVIPHTTQAWNVSGNTYTGADNRGAGYANSDLHYYLKNTVLPHVQNDLGSANLLAHCKLLTTDVNTSGYNKFGSASGCSSSWGWFDEYIAALSEVQVYGGTVWSSSGYDTGEACRQLEVFQKYSHTEIFGGEYPWLRDVASATNAAYADVGGVACHNTASNANYVAGLILFN